MTTDVKSALDKNRAFSGCRVGHLAVHPDSIVIDIESHDGIKKLSDAKVLGRFKVTGNPRFEAAVDMVISQQIMEILPVEDGRLLFNLNDGFFSIAGDTMVWEPTPEQPKPKRTRKRHTRDKNGKPKHFALLETSSVPNALTQLPMADEDPNAHAPRPEDYEEKPHPDGKRHSPLYVQNDVPVLPRRKDTLAAPFRDAYDALVQKAENKNHTRREVDELTVWLTTYSREQIQQALDSNISYEAFLKNSPEINPCAKFVKGSIEGVRVQSVQDPVVRSSYVLEKMVDELTKGRPLYRIMRTH